MHRQRGFSALEAILILLVVGLLAGVGYWVWNNSKKEDTTTTAATCGSKLFDSHTHLDDSEMPAKLAAVMQEHEVSCALIFAQMTPENYEEDSEMLQDDLGEVPAVFVPFFDVVRDRNSTLTTSYLDGLLADFEGKFRGFGEFALYRPDIGGTDLAAEPWTTLYKFAGEHDLVVMMHIGLKAEDLANLEAMMAAYPDTTFLIHGFELGAAKYAELLKKYPNLYYTLDTATLLKNPGQGKHLMYPSGEGSAAQFLNEYEQYKDELLALAKEDWAQIITAAPDRVMWGTDASFNWHADPAVYAKLVEFSNEFIASLPADVQAKYAYQNAVNVLGDKAVAF